MKRNGRPKQDRKHNRKDIVFFADLLERLERELERRNCRGGPQTSFVDLVNEYLDAVVPPIEAEPPARVSRLRQASAVSR
jgi:hypothetical protein